VISSVTNPFCDTCNRIRLTADGKIKNCLFSQSETDLLTAFRNGEDIRPLIIDTVLHKKKSRGGIDSFENPDNQKLFRNNRSMTTIGG
jgi:molybdenum cofactor biosynthesis enzyme MoaA